MRLRRWARRKAEKFFRGGMAAVVVLAAYLTYLLHRVHPAAALPLVALSSWLAVAVIEADEIKS